ncbi:double-strand-break repair protein rad21-like protein 1 [Neopsephotus bourkii]|uniref:double-strand-break repair protein rad21-like protein 1 n=1 Tax=Neopsephotus bourkii TaxID=309878 RepID=UPI002AA52D1C|nr:double-strand-break repair protein rad21-like protein 1 [Neopsephotus bourkii]
MFYMHLLVNKRGPLAKIWLAAHWEKKLTKAHIFECNLEATIEKILSPKFTIALRTSGHLLLGVVRIYHRKAKYLMADCSEALAKMKTAFRPGLVDLPKQTFEATYQAITLPEEFHDFETPLPDVNAIDVAEHFTLNQSRAEDITLVEDYESNLLLCDRNFDDKPDALRKQSFFDGSILTSSNSVVVDRSVSVNRDMSALREETFCFEYDCFGDEEDAADMIEILLRDEHTGLDLDILGMEEENPLSQEPLEKSTAAESCCADTINKEVSHLASETTLVLKDDGFVLEPLDATAVTQRKKNKRKRKLFVDVDKELTCYAMYNQLNNYTDITATLDLAPPTKKTMLWKKSGGVDKLLSHTTQLLLPAKLQMFLATCFKSHGFKMRRKEIQRGSEMEETRKEQEITEMLIVEEPSFLQESAHSDTERKIRHDSFMLPSENNRNVTDDHCGETIGAMVLSESSSLVTSILDQEAEMQQAELTNELTRNRKDSEEIRWNKRTLQFLKALQHLKRSGLSSFSFRDLSRKNNRKEAAAKFYILLVLKKQLVVELRQSVPFANITATPGPMFDAH